ncbi:MAG: methyl viologen-reducing hydrogenase [Candidatus Aminicenantes bacterium]|nr:methyl viologen-reducing hydrogenase [Candidatus Aminicenantes bacterium]NIM78106.1 methyl viologen-reducing hydrogenase [Candidatus Aminicenantes bacterium]NIN17424.1 methyl viologen-reducing hydrogenase [Candidatus Aminicenantes bacterium]NIN41320.1 methyl viologen-reducing hydrogenase [Candidatus Aminicenantes bacterium]NIN84090.1 methyl viologen-reducing hydrogenase [Candidatus Aminicenantes bacterium]
MTQVKLSSEWLSGCGGCHVGIVDLHDKIINVFEAVDIKHCPVLTDVKDYPQVNIALVEGAVRTEHDKEMLKKIRESTDLLIAFGTCAVFGGPSGIGWLHEKEDIFLKVFGKGPTTHEGTFPGRAPTMEHSVYPVDEIVPVDLYLPGCPPHPSFIFEALNTLVQGKEPRVSHRTVCSNCTRKIEKRDQDRLKRISEGVPEEDVCFLSQGYICLGSVTLDRCLSPCPQKGMICTGCNGPSINILIEPNRDIRTELAERMHLLTGLPEDVIESTIKEFAKTLYSYALASPLLYQKPAFHLREWITKKKEESKWQR